MLLAIGGDKGSPGATALAVALGFVWPAPRVVVELDPRGADLPFRLMAPNGQPMATAPSVVGLAIDARPGGAMASLDRYAQPTALGAPVIPGELSARANSRLTAHLPAVASAAARWSGTVIADLGGLFAGNAALTVARSAEAVLLVTRPTLEGLGHLRDRIDELTDVVADPRRTQVAVGVVLVTEPGNAKAATEQATRLLASVGSPAPVLGVFSYDPNGAAALWSGQPAKKLVKSHLLRSSREIANRIPALWPAFATVMPAQGQPDAVPPPPGTPALPMPPDSMMTQGVSRR